MGKKKFSPSEFVFSHGNSKNRTGPKSIIMRDKFNIPWAASNLFEYLLVYEVIRDLIVLRISACYLTASKLSLKVTSIIVT